MGTTAPLTPLRSMRWQNNHLLCFNYILCFEIMQTLPLCIWIFLNKHYQVWYSGFKWNLSFFVIIYFFNLLNLRLNVFSMYCQSLAIECQNLWWIIFLYLLIFDTMVYFLRIHLQALKYSHSLFWDFSIANQITSLLYSWASTSYWGSLTETPMDVENLWMFTAPLKTLS